MMKRILVILTVLLVAGVSWGAPSDFTFLTLSNGTTQKRVDSSGMQPLFGSSVGIGSVTLSDAGGGNLGISGSISQALPSGDLFVGNGSNVATAVTPTGDVTFSNTGVTLISTGAITNSKVSNSAAIAYSKLNLSASIVNADISSSAAIAYSKLNLASSIVDSDISSSAAISRSKIAAGTVSAIVTDDSLGNLASITGSQYQTAQAGSGGVPTFDAVHLDQSAAITGNLLVANGGSGGSSFTSNGVLYGNGSGPIQATSAGSANSILYANGGAPSFSQTPTINTSLTVGVNASQTGSLIMANGGVGGASVTLQNASANAAYNFNLPSSAGSNGQPLLSGGGGATAMTFGTLGIGGGGTGQVTATTAFNALSPLTTAGDTLYFNGSNNVRLAPGSSTQVLHSGSTPTWSQVSLTADVSGILPQANGGTGQNSTAVFPTSGNVLTDVNSFTVTNKTVDLLSNTVHNVDAEFDFTGDGTTTAFTLTAQNLLAGNTVLAYVDGRLQRGGGNAYSRTNANPGVITFTAAPDSGSWIHVVVVNQQ